MWIRVGLEKSIEKNIAFGANKSNESYFGAQLLLYDKITIPTHDFGIVPQLVNWCGMNELIQLLENDALSFAWADMMPVYGGGGAGLNVYAVGKPDKGWESWNQVARWAPMDESAEAQLHNSIPASWSNKAKN